MPKKRRKEIRKQDRVHQEDAYLAAPSYQDVIAKGRQLAEMWAENRETLEERQRLIYDYYSRPEIQRAMFEYASGRKISVLRTFRPLYNRLETPADILCIALYYAEQTRLWPSLHGRISRILEDGKRQVYDFVIEIDYKKSWDACFEATLPYIGVLRDFGIYACVKFSGNASAHVILPGETIPPDVSNARGQLMNYVQKIVKPVGKLDRSFTNAGHFLRLAYSIHEHTGLVSLPIEMDRFEQFSWKEAQVRRVQVLDSWWGCPPEDAPERVREFIQFSLSRYHLMQKAEITERRQKLKERSKRDKPMPGDKATLKGLNYKLAQCCSPQMGDGIVGYFREDGTITVHRSDCAVVRRLRAERLLNVTWQDLPAIEEQRPEPKAGDAREEETFNCLVGPTPERRIRGLKLLAELGDAALFDWCAMFLNDASSDVVVAALQTMRRCDAVDTAVIAPLAESDDKRVRTAAIAALVAHSDEDALHWFERGLKDREACVRLETAGILWQLDAIEHRALFERARHDPNLEIRRLAMKLTTGK